MSITLDEDSVEEILYLARANETTDLEAFLSGLTKDTKHSKAELIAAAVDPHSKNGALHYAAANGHIDVLKLLLSPNPGQVTPPNRETINAVNDAGNTPLHYAALNGNLECVKLLIDLGAEVTIKNKAGHDPVFEAEINDKNEVVDWFLEELEELEKAVGEDGDGEESEDTAGEDEKDEKDLGNNSSAAGVEDVQKQLEGMNTNDRTVQGG